MCNGKSCGGMCIVSWVVKILVIVGAVNWGLVGVGMLMGSEWNLVAMLLGSWPMVEAVVYVLVGVAGVMQIFGCKCKKCMGGTCGTDEKMAGSMGGQQM